MSTGRFMAAVMLYSWETYELCNGSQTTLTKYNDSRGYGTMDNKTEFKDYD